MSYTWEQARDLIARYESNFRNVVNHRYGPGHTASGYWQITDTNWKTIAPRLGITPTQYPRAIDAPIVLQEKVAKYLFDTRGFLDWAPYNPALAAAIRRGETVSGNYQDGGNVAPVPKSLQPIIPIATDAPVRRVFLLGVGAILIVIALGTMR